MATDLYIQEGVIIPECELEVTTSRSGGAGGQHVNKTDSRVTVRWNALHTIALTEEQRVRVLHKLRTQLTTEGDLLVHNSTSRSQQQNKEAALERLVQVVRAALHVPKKRKPTKVSKAAKEARLKAKTQRSALKKLRRQKVSYD